LRLIIDVAIPFKGTEKYFKPLKKGRKEYKMKISYDYPDILLKDILAGCKKRSLNFKEGFRVFLLNKNSVSADSLTKPLPEVYGDTEYIGVLYYLWGFENPATGEDEVLEILATSEQLEGCNISEQKAWAYAFENLESNFLVFSNVVDILKMTQNLSNTEEKFFKENVPPTAVITNREEHRGASSIFLVDRLKKELSSYGYRKVYLMPVSVHYFLAISVKKDNLTDCLTEVVGDSNKELIENGDENWVLGDKSIFLNVR
jgi:hypothetical protein